MTLRDLVTLACLVIIMFVAVKLVVAAASLALGIG